MRAAHMFRSVSRAHGAVPLLRATVMFALCASLMSACRREVRHGADVLSPPKQQVRAKVVINEAVRTLIYLPLYFAQDSGCFGKKALEVSIVTGGTATNSFAALVSGEADIAIADPMYVPIAREKGNQTRVIGQLVGRIAVWGVTSDRGITGMTAATLRGKTIATHPQPMTAYLYTVRAVEALGLKPDRDVKILQVTPGSEIVPLLNHTADYALTLEPNVSRATAQGAHVVLSFPETLGDQIFTGILAREDYLAKHRYEALSIVACVQEAFDTIRTNPEDAIPVARKWFPQVEEPILRTALRRIVDEQVIPKSVVITEESWAKAIRARVEAGDLKAPSPLEASVDVSVMTAGAASVSAPVRRKTLPRTQAPSGPG
jgi:NitT/TauT family transport system substrate-binding protein